MDVTDKRLIRKIDFGERLARARIRLQLSQEALAEAVGTTARSISRWERDQTIPQQYYRERLCEVLQIPSEALFFGVSSEQSQEKASPLSFWYVPYARNLYFTGRETILNQIHEALQAGQHLTVIQPQIVSGLGGIGKTQTILEYTYRFRREYQAILWINAKTRESIMSDYLVLAQLFQLPEKGCSHQVVVREAVKRWFQIHNDWLLVFDNVEELELLQTMLPDASQGHIIITTRSQAVGTLGIHLNLLKMDRVEATLFLLRRAKLLSLSISLEAVAASMRTQAEDLTDLLEGLPLALDQAGAYIEETKCTLAEYLERYTVHRKILLSNRGIISNHHPASVTTTFSLTFRQVEQASPIAADLLRVCAFLHAEAIPEEFFTHAGETLGPTLKLLGRDPLLLDAAIRDLSRFSLIHREQGTRTLSIHRLLQAVIQDRMEKQECQQWIARVILSFLSIFSVYDDGANYSIEDHQNCQSYLTHIIFFANILKIWEIESIEACELLYRTSIYFRFCGDLTQATLLMQQSLHITKNVFRKKHGLSVLYTNEIAIIFMNLKRYKQAEEHYQQSLAIREKILGPDHPKVADSLRDIANLFCLMGMYTHAEFFARRALAIDEQAFGHHHYMRAMDLALLGTIYAHKGQQVQAEALLQSALDIYKNTLEEGHFFVG